MPIRPPDELTARELPPDARNVDANPYVLSCSSTTMHAAGASSCVK